MASTRRCIQLTIQKENQINEFTTVLSNERDDGSLSGWSYWGAVSVSMSLCVLPKRKKIYLLVEYEPLLYPASELGIGITLVPSPEQAYSSPRHYREMEEMEDPRK